MANSDNVTLWYFIGMFNGDVIHVEHDVLASGETGRLCAEDRAHEWFHRGININGQIVQFDRVVAISENHEIALDVKYEAHHHKECPAVDSFGCRCDDIDEECGGEQ